MYVRKCATCRVHCTWKMNLRAAAETVLDWLCAGILSALCYGSLLKALKTKQQKKDLLTGEVVVGSSGRIFCYHFCLLAVLAAYVAKRCSNV